MVGDCDAVGVGIGTTIIRSNSGGAEPDECSAATASSALLALWDSDNAVRDGNVFGVGTAMFPNTPDDQHGGGMSSALSSRI